MIKNLIAGIIAGLLIGGIWGWFAGSSEAVVKNITSEKAIEFRMDMRKLWEDHITWTRIYLVSFAYSNKGTDNIAERLLRSQEDIGDAIKPYYGNDSGNKLTRFLKTHTNTAVEVVSAAKVKDKNALHKANDR